MREKIIIKSRNFNKFAPTHPLLNDCPTHPPLKDKESDKKKIKSSFIVLTLIFFSFFILGCGGVLAQTTPAGLNYQQNQFSNPQSQFYSPSFQSYYAQQGIDYTQFWPILSNSDECEARQDFIVNVRPGSCMPSVVRSDLLEEQNVPIFCKLDAIKLNPLIDVGAMKSVRFKGEYPKEIAGISFHPSQAALRIYNPILDSPILNDVGYAVVVLKKQESERTMPDSVKVDLTAVLTYDFQNVFGAGQTKYYVPVLNDFDWSQKYQDYGFWKGAGYVRVDWVETGRAGISVYSDSNNILRKFSLEKGQTSDLVYMPGFYCRAGVMIRLNEVSSAKPRARLQVDNEQEIWVVEGENFLDSQCVVKNIFGGVGGGGSVVLSCRGGDIVLSLGVLDTVKIQKNGNERQIILGNLVNPEVEKDNEKIYLAYIGHEIVKENGKDVPKPFIILVKNVNTANLEGNAIQQKTLVFIQQNAEKWIRENKDNKNKYKNLRTQIGSQLGGTEIDIVDVGGKGFNDYKFMGMVDVEDKREETAGIKLEYNKETKVKINKVKWVIDEIISDIGGERINLRKTSSVEGISYSKEEFETKLKNGEIQLISDSTTPSTPTTTPQNTEKYFQLANETAEQLVREYGSEKKETGDFFGARALWDLAELAGKMGKKKTQIGILQRLVDVYTTSNLAKQAQYELGKLDTYNYEKAGTAVSLGTQTYYIKLESVQIPGIDDASAEFKIDKGKQTPFLIDDYIIPPIFGETSSPYIKLKKLENEYVEVEYRNCERTAEGKSYTLGETKTKIVKIGEVLSIEVGKDNKCDGSGSVTTKTIRLNKINLKQTAEVEVISQVPDGTSEANFTFAIGIEKRDFSLSPEKAKEKIKNLDISIKDWEKRVETLGEVVKVWKGACFATSGYLMVKNLFNNLGGASLARQKVMRNSGGWFDKCAEMVSEGKGTYKNVDECLAKNNGKIEADVSEAEKEIKDINDKIIEVQKNNLEGQGIFGKQVDDKKAAEEFKTDYFNKFIKDNSGVKIDVDGNKKTLGNINTTDMSISDMRDIMFAVKMSKSDSNVNKDMGARTLENVVTPIFRESDIKEAERKANLAIKGAFPEITDARVNTLNRQGADAYVYAFDIKENSLNILNGNGKAEAGKYFAVKSVVASGGLATAVLGSSASQKTYLIKLKPSSLGSDSIKIDYNSVYEETINKGTTTYTHLTKEQASTAINNVMSQNGIGKFVEINEDMCKYGYKDPKVKYYETEPNKGVPAVVPVDLKRGWYAATRQIVPGFGVSSSVQSGAISSFWVCNVGKNGKEEWGTSLGDDRPCTQVNLNTGQAIDQLPCLSPSEAKTLVLAAKRILEEAASKYGKAKSGKISLSLLSGAESIDVGPAVSTPGTQCQDFMSPSDCSLLFNVCDPVLCPTSRCDFGGRYKVDNVIQSGIIGSVLLCLPNFGNPTEGGVAVPVCLTGIHAGLDAYVSILKAYRDCLKENIESGKYVGICDEIHSIYLCEFFWKQAAPLLEFGIPKIIEMIYTGKARGGGEYSTFTNAWDNMKNSVTYFTDYYGVNTFKAFRSRSTAEVGTEFCNAFISQRYPSNKNMFDSLLEPDSPVQFHAWFDENIFSEATVPTTSQYKVYYHIYAGKDKGSYYSVYLKSPPETGYYSAQPYITIDTGYVGVGQNVDKAKDFTAPSGYKELCVRIDAQEKCGFKTVSTSAAVNYLKDFYIEEQTTKEITSEAQCVSGSPSLWALAGSPNIQSGVEQSGLVQSIYGGTGSALYQSGIIRVCSTDNPGNSTNPSRWTSVGWCDKKDGEIKCWLDGNSVENAVKDLKLENDILTDAQQKMNDIEKLGAWPEEKTNSELAKAKQSFENAKNTITDESNFITLFDEIIKHGFFNTQKAEAMFYKVEVYIAIVRNLLGDGTGTTARSGEVEKCVLKNIEDKTLDMNSLSPTLVLSNDKWSLVINAEGNCEGNRVDFIIEYYDSATPRDVSSKSNTQNFVIVLDKKYKAKFDYDFKEGFNYEVKMNFVGSNYEPSIDNSKTYSFGFSIGSDGEIIL